MTHSSGVIVVSFEKVIVDVAKVMLAEIFFDNPDNCAITV